jgi:hypothetical protein
VPLRWRLEGRVLASMLALKECRYESVRRQIGLFQSEMEPLSQDIDAHEKRGGNAAYWKALHAEVSEAIFKMKFVRMELRSRLVMLTRAQIVDTPDETEKTERFAAGVQTYPSDGDVWADEVFVKHGSGESACTTLHKAKVVQ